MILDIGESRVSQIHTGALIRLRSRLQDRLGQGFASETAPAKTISQPRRSDAKNSQPG